MNETNAPTRDKLMMQATPLNMVNLDLKKVHTYNILFKCKLDPVRSTVRCEMMKLFTGSVQYSNGWYLVVLSQYEVIIDVNGSAECTYAFIHWKKWKSSGVTDP